MILFVSIGYTEYEKISIEDCLFLVPMYIKCPNFDEKKMILKKLQYFQKSQWKYFNSLSF